MRIGRWAGLLLAAAPFLAGCGDFWQAPSGSSNGSYSLSNSGNVLVATGSTGTSTITVTPSNSSSQTVSLSCAVTSSLSNPTSPTCTLSPTSVSISGTTSQTSTLTVTTTSSTTVGAYTVTVTGTSGNLTADTTLCAEVSTSGTTTCSSSSTGNSGNFFMVNSSSVAGYSIQSGTVTALSSAAALPSGVTPFPGAMAVDPTGSFLYVGTNNGILLYTIGSGGALTQNTSATINDVGAYGLAIDSTGQWLLDASNTTTGPVLFAWPINPSTGASTLGTGISAPAETLTGSTVGPGGIAISKDNKLVAVAAGTKSEVFAFTAGSGDNGSTNPFGTAYTITATGTAVSVGFDPSSSPAFLYIGSTGAFSSPATNTGGLHMIPIASDVPGNEASGSPYPSGGTGPHGILAASNGYVYVANWESTSAGNITAFLLNASSQTLTVQNNSVAVGVEPYGLVEDSKSTYVMTVNSQGSTPLSVFTFDSTTAGKLDAGATGSTIASPVAIAAVP